MRTVMGPYNREAEEEVLGAILLKPSILDDVIPILSPEDFADPTHRKIFKAMVDMHHNGEAITPISVRDTLARWGVRVNVERLNDLMINVLSPSAVKIHAQAVRRFSILRKIIDLSLEMAQRARKMEKEPEELLDEMEARVFQMIVEERPSEFVNLKDLSLRIMEAVISGKEILGVPTGIAPLDAIIHGYTPGSLIVIGARPGVGKTAFMVDLALRLLDRGYLPALFSLEMDAEQILARMMASISKVPLNDILSGRVSPGQVGALTQAVDRISSSRMILDDDRFLDILTLKSKIRQAQRHGAKVIFVDYLQLIQPRETRKRRMRYEEIAEITRSLKILAGEIRVSIVLLSQLSRDVEKREDSRPRLADLRESGAIEQDADVVIFLHDPEALESRKEYTQVEVMVAKNRQGPTGEFTLAFHRPTMRFEEGEVEVDEVPF